MVVDELYIYPLKSAASQAVSQMSLQLKGPQWDREWLLVDSNGKFLSQRTQPKLATVRTHVDEDGLSLSWEKMFFKIPRRPSSRKLTVQIWNDQVEADLQPDLYSQALSQYLGVDCRLVRFSESSERPHTRFADSRPIQIFNLKSLEDLNSRLQSPVTADRFRANIIFNGSHAYEEDTWLKIRVGDVVFSQPKPCARCAIINTDQKTGQVLGPDPLKTLSTYRRMDKGVVLGRLWIPENEGPISKGSSIEVLETC